MTGDGVVAAALTATLSEERLRLVATLIRVTGDWDLAEDCVQDAVERALSVWPRDGVPRRPGAWLTTTARHRAMDVLRRRRTEADKLAQLAVTDLGREDEPEDPYRDDRLRLLFTCCHPALPLAGQVALTLKTVAGLDTAQIAHAFFVSEATMSQRLLRAKQKIAHAGIPYAVPEPHRLRERVAGVLAVVYLVFNEGYLASSGAGTRDDLAAEAVRLARLVDQLLGDDDEAAGLLALLLFQHARRAARTDATGALVPMEEQDRGRWDRAAVAAGLTALTRSAAGGREPGPYRLQAEIAACHVTATDAGSTDWAAVVGLYDRLYARHPTAPVALNRAVALAFRDGPLAGLAELDRVAAAPELVGGWLVASVRADLLRRLGHGRAALEAYAVALTLAQTDAERSLLLRRRDALRAADPENA